MLLMKYCDALKSIPDNNTLTKYFHDGHNVTIELNVIIFQNNVKNAGERKFYADKWLSKLQTFSSEWFKH